MKIDKMEHKQIDINGVSIFYREAGNPKNATILLLHGFPSSSHMYRNLMDELSDEYHLIAPDYPGFGFSDLLDISEFEYSFENIFEIIETFIERLEIESFYLLMQDYGGPVGFRIATKHPYKIKGLIIQNANAYMEGLGEWAMQIGSFQENNDMGGLVVFKDWLMSLDGLKEQYLGGTQDASKVDPIAYLMDNALLKREKSNEIQTTLFFNYGTNFPKYPEWQNYFRTHQPKTLVLWGENDRFFSKAGGEAYRKDLNNIETHFFNGGHFMLEEYSKESSSLIRAFIKKK